MRELWLNNGDRKVVKMTKQQSVEYLKKVLENWGTWRVHHEQLCQAIEVLLEAVKNEDRNN